jgi:cytochrome c6
VLLTITTTGKVTLLIVAGAFIAWALITAIWIPKRNRDFPATLTGFVMVSALFLVAQLGAIWWVETTQEVATTEAVPAETTPTTTTPASTTPAATTPASTTPATTTPASGGGDPVAGKAVFTSAGCVSCHTLKDAGATGAVGPNLDEKKPDAALVVDRVTNGKGVMPSFKGQLSEQQIKDVAAYVSSVAGS